MAESSGIGALDRSAVPSEISVWDRILLGGRFAGRGSRREDSEAEGVDEAERRRTVMVVEAGLKDGWVTKAERMAVPSSPRPMMRMLVGVGVGVGDDILQRWLRRWEVVLRVKVCG